MHKENKNGELITVIIPCKNETDGIIKLLNSLIYQTIVPAQIIIADANSTDGTVEKIIEFKEQFGADHITIIQGGKVAYGRNKGAEIAKTKYLFFIDADMQLKQIDTLDKTVKKMELERLEMCTANIRCNSDNKLSDFIYKMNNFGQKVAKFINSPFSTGAYMCITRDKFFSLLGFDEELQFCEDYWLSKQIHKDKFGIVNCNIYTSDRRFKKSGYFWMVKNFIKSYLNRNNREYFKKDFNYWI
jgi:glycosyltransferase involved in cell wall biosynthesis